MNWGMEWEKRRNELLLRVVLRWVKWMKRSSEEEMKSNVEKRSETEWMTNEWEEWMNWPQAYGIEGMLFILFLISFSAFSFFLFLMFNITTAYQLERNAGWWKIKNRKNSPELNGKKMTAILIAGIFFSLRAVLRVGLVVGAKESRNVMSAFVTYVFLPSIFPIGWN